MSIVLTAGSVDLNDGVNTVLLGLSLGKPIRVSEEFGGPGVDLALVGAVDMSGLVDTVFRVGIIAASVDAATAKVGAIADELTALSLITLQLDGSAYPSTFTPRIAQCVEIPLEYPRDVELMRDYKTIVDLVVRRNPYMDGAAEILHSAAGFDCPALVPLDAQTGQFRTPLDLFLDALALQLAGCYVGHTEDESAVIGDFVRPLAAASWSAGATTTEAAGYPDGVGDTCWRHNGIAYTDVDVTGLDGGEYLPLVNVKGTTANVDTIQHAYCGPVLIPTNALRLLPLPVLSLPTKAVRGAVTDTLRITIAGGTGTEYAYINYVAFLPVSNGLTGYVLAGGHVHTLRWENGALYADDAIDNSKVYGGAAPMRTLGGQLVVLAEQLVAAPTTHLHATVTA